MTFDLQGVAHAHEARGVLRQRGPLPGRGAADHRHRPRTRRRLSTSDAHLATPSGKPHARALGIPFGGEPGPWNAVTDVPGLEVGYATLIEGEGVRTGVTAIHPLGRGRPDAPRDLRR